MVRNADYQANDFLARALKKLAQDKFDKMIVFLAWDHVDCTNNHVERNNRVFRMLQKTRYKRRKTHTLEKALELDSRCTHAETSIVSKRQRYTATQPRGATSTLEGSGIVMITNDQCQSPPSIRHFL